MARQITADAMDQAAGQEKSGNLDEAKRLYAQVLSADPANKKAKKALKALVGKGRAQLTPADFERVARLMQSGKLNSALADINKLCRLHPEQPALHNLRGVILSRYDQPVRAVDAYQTALKLEPAFAEALNNLATAFTELKRYQEALGCYQELVNRGIADAEVYANLARALRGAGQRDNALEALKRALKFNPLYADALNDLGNLFNDMGQLDQAIDAYERALGIEPRHRKALLNLARSLTAMSKPIDSLAVFEEILTIDPKDEDALRGAASALQSVNRDTEAVKYYQRLLQVRPEDSVARHMLTAISGQTVSRGSPAYARTLFEGYAANVEQHLTGPLAYSLPEKIPGWLELIDGEDAWYPYALDLGCGTGLVGLQMRSYCEHLTGVDVSHAMLDKASEKAVYDQLLPGDINTMLRDSDSSFDLVLCIDVLIYLGALEDVFKGIAARCNPGARFVMSTEQSGGEDLRLQRSGRFTHSGDYVLRCAQAAGFTLLHRENVSLRKERDAWLPGELFMFSLGEKNA